MPLVAIMGVLGLVSGAPLAAQVAATPPVPQGSMTDWIHPDDYPPASMRMGDEGRVSVQLGVDANGMVTGCTIANSSGHPLLDARTCTLLTQRARFQPARDASGRAVPATTPVMSLRWQLPAAASASAPAAPSSASAADVKIIDQEALFFQTMGGPSLLADQPVTPARIMLAKALLNVVKNGGNQQALESVGRSLIEKRFAPTIASLPPRAQTLAKADLGAAYDAAWQDSQRDNLDELARYYAARLTDDEMHKLVDFFSSGIGYRNIHHTGQWTEEDRLAFGKAAFARPELAKWTKLNFELMQGLAERTRGQQQVFQNELTAALCPRLAHDHIHLSACPIIKPAHAAGKARPPRLLTAHLQGG